MSYNDFIKTYFSSNFVPPYRKESDLHFTIWSHNKWAINESIQFVNEHSDMTIQDALTLFVYTWLAHFE